MKTNKKLKKELQEKLMYEIKDSNNALLDLMKLYKKDKISFDAIVLEAINTQTLISILELLD